MASEFYDHAKSAFQETLDLIGVPISFVDPAVGKTVTKKCVTGAIERKRNQQVAGHLPDASTVVDMLVEDFEALGAIEQNKSIVVVDGTKFAVMTIDGDPMDPCVRIILRKDV